MRERISKERIKDGLAHGLITFRMEYNQLVDLIYRSINDYSINDDDDDLAIERFCKIQ